MLCKETYHLRNMALVSAKFEQCHVNQFAVSEFGTKLIFNFRDCHTLFTGRYFWALSR